MGLGAARTIICRRRRSPNASLQRAHRVWWSYVLRAMLVLLLLCRVMALRRTVPAHFGRLAQSLDLGRIESALLRVPGSGRDSDARVSRIQRSAAHVGAESAPRDEVDVGTLAVASRNAFLRGASCLSGPTAGAPLGSDTPASPAADADCAVLALQEAWQLRDQWLRAAGDTQALTTTLQSPPPAYHILLNLGVALHMRGSGAAANTSDHAAALHALREAARLAPEDADCHLNLASVLLRHCRGAGGLEELRQAADSARVAAQIRPRHVATQLLRAESAGALAEHLSRPPQSTGAGVGAEQSVAPAAAAAAVAARASDVAARLAIELAPDHSPTLFASASILVQLVGLQHVMGGVVAAMRLLRDAAAHMQTALRLEPRGFVYAGRAHTLGALLHLHASNQSMGKDASAWLLSSQANALPDAAGGCGAVLVRNWHIAAASWHVRMHPVRAGADMSCCTSHIARFVAPMAVSGEAAIIHTPRCSCMAQRDADVCRVFVPSLGEITPLLPIAPDAVRRRCGILFGPVSDVRDDAPCPWQRVGRALHLVPAVSGTSHGRVAAANHYLTLCDALPRLLLLHEHDSSLASDADADLHIIVAPGARTWLQPVLDSLRWRASVLEYSPRSPLIVQRLVAVDWGQCRRNRPSCFWPQGWTSLRAQQRLPTAQLDLPPGQALVGARTLLLRSLGTAHAVPTERSATIVVVVREGTAQRRIAGKDERRLLDALRQLYIPHIAVRVVRYGADVTVPKPATTAALFASAAAVIGVHGAGLANALMCAPGTALIEIGFGAANALSTKLHYEHLATALNLEYRFLPVFAQAEFRASVLQLDATWRRRIVNETAAVLTLTRKSTNS